MRALPLTIAVVGAGLLVGAGYSYVPIIWKNAGTNLGVASTVNCSTGMSCSKSGGTVTLTSTGGGGTGSPGGSAGDLQTNDGAGGFGGYAGSGTCSAHTWFTALSSAGAKSCSQPDYSDLTGTPTIPTDLSAEPFITKTASGNLSNEFALGSLASGLLLNTTTTGVPTIYAGATCSANQYMTALDASGAKTCAQVAYSQVSGTPTIPADISGAHYVTTQAESGLSAEAVLPTCTGTDKLTFNGTSLSCATDQTGAGTDLSGEPFITKTASSNLSNEFALGSLATGILKNTTTTGVPTIAVSGSDYAPATSGSVLLLGDGSGGFSNYGGATSCSNQFFTGLSSAGASTCTTATLASAQFANQGTTHTTLHGNASGNPSFVADDLAADVTGVLPLANGGTAANLTASNGQAAYSTASALALTTSGATGQILSFNSGSAPTWIAGPRMVRVSGSNFTTTSTTASTVTGLSWSVTSGTPYYFHCGISATGSSTGGPRLLTNLSSTATTIVASITNHTTVVTTLLYTGETTAAGTLTASCTTSCLTTNIPFIIQGMFVPSASETFAIQAANSTSGQTTTVFVGSMCIWWTP